MGDWEGVLGVCFAGERREVWTELMSEKHAHITTRAKTTPRMAYCLNLLILGKVGILLSIAFRLGELFIFLFLLLLLLLLVLTLLSLTHGKIIKRQETRGAELL